MRQEKEITWLFLILATFLGLYARLAAPAQAGFPVLDGGLFYTMANNLIQHHFRPPLTTSYNHLGIPFAYPPLGIFLLAWLAKASGWNLLEAIRWLPGLISLLTLPAFYGLAREMLRSPSQAALATLLYAALPRAYEWNIMGGGVTRAPGTLFYLLFVWMAYRAFTRQEWRATLLAAVMGGLTLLTHPERSLHAAAAGLLFWLWLGRSREGTLRALAISGGTLLISAPWWAIVIGRYGLSTIWLATQAGEPRWLFWAPLLQVDFTDESLPLTALLALLGALLAWQTGQRLLPLWFLLIFFTDPRSAPHVIGAPAALLASFGLSQGIFPLFGPVGQGWLASLQQRNGKVALTYLVILLTFNVQSNLLILQERYILAPADQEAMAWIAEHIPSDKRFLALGWEQIPSLSPFLEWFPALSERMNIATLQGREWLEGKAHFKFRVDTFPELYACLFQETECLEEWARSHDETFDYVYLSLSVPGGGIRLPRLADALRNAAAYQLVYESPAVLIFERR